MAGGSVVTGDGHEVDGRDPATGTVLWSYARDLDLCGVTSVYNYAVAVYPDSRGCGQVTTIDGQTGMRGPSRTAYADPEIALSSDGTTVLVGGRQPARAVALRHGPDDQPRRAGRPNQTRRSRPGAVPAGIRGGQHGRGGGARSVSRTSPTCG